MKTCLLTIGVFSLAACQNMHDTTVDALDKTQQYTDNEIDKARDKLGVGHAAIQKPVPQNRFCYQITQDIVCYAEPQTQQDLSMTGFQTKKDQVGYQMDDLGHPLPPLSAVNVPLASPVAGTNSPYTTASSVNSPNAMAKKPAVPQQGVHEIIFDASELQPKELVQTKPQ